MTDGRRARAIAAIVCLQAVAAAFFAIDAYSDLQAQELGAHIVIEGVVAAALLLGVTLNALELRDLLQRQRRADRVMVVASGALAELIQLRFQDWRLTPAEADVALFALKGLPIEDIARLREAATGTVRAQLARVYAKAGVRNRYALLSLFMDDLLGQALVQVDRKPPAPASAPPPGSADASLPGGPSRTCSEAPI